MSGSLAEGFGDFTRAGIADVGNKFQDFLLSRDGIGAPEPMIGDMVTTHDPERAEPMNDRQLQYLIDSQQQVQPPAPSDDVERRGAAEPIEPPGPPLGMTGETLPPERDVATPGEFAAVDDSWVVEGAYEEVPESHGYLTGPEADGPDMG